jgi:hypothetical protein
MHLASDQSDHLSEGIGTPSEDHGDAPAFPCNDVKTTAIAFVCRKAFQSIRIGECCISSDVRTRTDLRRQTYSPPPPRVPCHSINTLYLAISYYLKTPGKISNLRFPTYCKLDFIYFLGHYPVSLSGKYDTSVKQPNSDTSTALFICKSFNI